MDWLKAVAGSLVTAALAWLFAVNKSASNTAVQIATVNARLDGLDKSLEEYRKDALGAQSKMTDKLEAATRELQAASANIQAMSQTQQVVNSMTAKILDSMSAKLDTNTDAIARIGGQVSELRVILDNSNS